MKLTRRATTPEIPYFQGESDRANRDKQHSVEQMK
jgi:hypothetical protein